MMQSLLADRFKLAVHFEKQQIPALALHLAKSDKPRTGLSLHSDGPPCDVAGTVFPQVCGIFGIIPAGVTTREGVKPPANMFQAGARDTTVEQIANWLSGNLARPVIDETGLTGRYDFSLQWTPQQGDPIAPLGPQSDAQGPTFLQAIREQLGLTLDSARAAVETLIVDHVERPTGNDMASLQEKTDPAATHSGTPGGGLTAPIRQPRTPPSRGAQPQPTPAQLANLLNPGFEEGRVGGCSFGATAAHG